MLINIKVIPRAKKINIKEENSQLKVYLTAPAIEGKANKLLLGVLASYYKVRRSSVEIVRGEKSREKVIKINGL